MAFKIKHISTRFLLQSIFTILIIAILIFIMFYSGYRKKDTLKAQSLVSEIHTSLILADLYLESALDQQKADMNFVESGCDLLIDNHNKKIIGIDNNLELLKEIKFLRPFFKKTNYSDSLISSTQQYSTLFSKTLYSLKEKGNLNGGAIQNAEISIRTVADELSLAPDNGLQAANFNGYASAYLGDLSYSKLLQLLSFCDEIMVPFYYMEDYDSYALEEYSNALKEKLQYIQSIDLRLEDFDNNAGQLVDLEFSYTELTEQFTRFDLAVQHQIQRYNSWWIFVFLTLAIVLTAAYILVMGQFSHLVRNSVRKLHKITVGLAHGSIVDTVPEGGKYEFEEYNKDLKSLFALLNNRKEFIEHLLNDKFEETLEIKDNSDSIGLALLDLKNKMHAAKQEQIKYNQENSDRRYINEGLAKFGDIMRINSHDTNLLADAFIKELVKYMGALQGALFLSEEDDDNMLNLVAAFAYDRKRFLEKAIKKGEGLIGTCAIERKTINLDEVPEGYISIKSGLGDTPPNHILILPVMNEEELVGVIEMASLKAFTIIEIELAENIAENLASTLIAAKINSKTSQLLKKSQEQAAEMAEQEEEMRQNMEELKATQEETTRREEEMQGLLDAIGKSFYVLEYDLSANIIHVNDRLLEFIEQSVDYVLHKTHQDVLSSDSKITQDFIGDLIYNNKPVSFEEVMNWGSKKYKYRYSLSPVENGVGQVVKVLNLFSIEEEASDS